MKSIIVTICLCAMAFSASAQENLLKNGDFEAGNDGSWVLKPHEKDEKTATIATSNGVMNSDCAKLGVMNKSLEASFEQALTLEAGSKYVFSGVCFYSAVPTNDKTAKIQILSAADRSILQEIEIPTGTFWNTSNILTEDAAKDFVVTFDIDETISGDVILSFTNGGIDKLIRFDNLSVKETGTSGVANVTTENMTVKAINGCIVVSGQGLTKVAIYSVSGQLVKVVDMNGADEVIVEGLQKGVYVIGSNKVML